MTESAIVYGEVPGEPDAAARRLVTLEGAANFRDLGGYRTADGGRIRWGQVYRSAALHRLTAVDLATIDRLGLRVVYDLRGTQEREEAPSLLPDGVRSHSLPIGGGAAQTHDIADRIRRGELGEFPPDFLEQIYQSMAQSVAPTFGRLLELLAEPDGIPALIHCTAGKDRTGMSVALLLSTLGVADADILDDYVLSEIHYTQGQIARMQSNDPDIDVERFRSVLGAPRQAMGSLLNTLRDSYGSVEAYLLQEAGVAPEVLDTLRTRLVQPA